MILPADVAKAGLTDEEDAVLRSAERDGYVSADLYSQGDFSEEGFLLFGRLEVMCLKGLLRFVERCGESERSPGDVKMVFAPAYRTCAADSGMVAAL